MKVINKLPLPLWDMDDAAKLLKLLENDYNSLDLERISANFAPDSEARFGMELIKGRAGISKYLTNYLAEKVHLTCV